MDVRRIEEIRRIQKEHFDEEFKKEVKRVTKERERKATFYKCFGYIPKDENTATKRKAESKAKKAKRRRVKRQSKRRNRK